MDNGKKIQTIGVKKETIDLANKIHYDCRPKDWQLFEILVSFCKDCPKEFENWKKEKIKKIQESWKKKKK